MGSGGGEGLEEEEEGGGEDIEGSVMVESSDEGSVVAVEGSVMMLGDSVVLECDVSSALLSYRKCLLGTRPLFYLTTPPFPPYLVPVRCFHGSKGLIPTRKHPLQSVPPPKSPPLCPDSTPFRFR